MTQEQSAAQLVHQASEQISRLVRDELHLAQVELTIKAKRIGGGAGLFAGAALLVAYAVGVLIIAAVLGLAHVVSAWLAALLVGVALVLIAGALALWGKRVLQRGVPLAPQEAIHSVKADMDEVLGRSRG